MELTEEKICDKKEITATHESLATLNKSITAELSNGRLPDQQETFAIITATSEVNTKR